MHPYMSKHLSLVLLIGSILFAGFGLAAHAQSAQRPADAAFRDKLLQLDRQMALVEQRFGVAAKQIESSAKLTAQDYQAPALEQGMEAYAAALKSVLEEALTDTERAAKTNGREGDATKLPALEALMKAHERKMTAMQTRGDNIYAQIKAGRIVLDRAVLEPFSPAEREEFSSFLSAAGRKPYPVELVPGSRSSLEFPRFADLTGSVRNAANRLSVKGCTDWIAGSIIGTAEGAALAGCAAACAYAWPSCIACVGLVAGLTVQNWSVFQSCWSGSGKGRWTPLWLWRTKCVAFLVLIVG